VWRVCVGVGLRFLRGWSAGWGGLTTPSEVGTVIVLVLVFVFLLAAVLALARALAERGRGAILISQKEGPEREVPWTVGGVLCRLGLYGKV
jgi:hypothetical protein